MPQELETNPGDETERGTVPHCTHRVLVSSGL